MSQWSGIRVLVTGGTGFIGGRLVATLAHGCRARVRVLVRDVRRAAQVARYPVELCPGDLTDAESVARAADGCDVIFHCAFGTQGSDDQKRIVTVSGTENVLAAAARARTRRLVHVSTAAVYSGNPQGAHLTEDATPRRTGIQYVDSKIAAEEAVRAAARRHGFETVICQPTIVYGPFARMFTTSIVRQLKTGRVILVDGGAGTCNAVYVDDVVRALLLAGKASRAAGETFLVSGPDTTTWREFYGRFERFLGLADRLVSMSEGEARNYSRTGDTRRWLLGELLRHVRDDTDFRNRLATTVDAHVLVRTLWPIVRRLRRARDNRRRVPSSTIPARPASSASNLPVHNIPPSRIGAMASRTVVQTGKAERLLGFRPTWAFDQGMAVTEEWMRWARLQ